MAGICIDNSRRNYHYLCKYYKKKNINDNTLKHEETPDGYFYAREIRDQEQDTQEIVGSYQIPFEIVHIETPDNVNVAKNDIVYFDNHDWLVEKVVEREMTKRIEFCSKAIKYKEIWLRK